MFESIKNFFSRIFRAAKRIYVSGYNVSFFVYQAVTVALFVATLGPVAGIIAFAIECTLMYVLGKQFTSGIVTGIFVVVLNPAAVLTFLGKRIAYLLCYTLSAICEAILVTKLDIVTVDDFGVADNGEPVPA